MDNLRPYMFRDLPNGAVFWCGAQPYIKSAHKAYPRDAGDRFTMRRSPYTLCYATQADAGGAPEVQVVRVGGHRTVLRERLTLVFDRRSSTRGAYRRDIVVRYGGKWYRLYTETIDGGECFIRVLGRKLVVQSDDRHTLALDRLATTR